MSSVQIQGYECRLDKIFSKEFKFHIPLYQRPYSWEKEQAEELITDLLSAFQSQDLDEDFPYFLGSLVLIKQPDKPFADVVDGQQRLTTLTILLAVLAHLSEDVGEYVHTTLIRGVYEPLTPPKLRLVLRHQDEGFFEKYIQAEGGIKGLAEIKAAELPDSQRCIRDNALVIQQEINQVLTNKEEVLTFLRFILSNVSLVVVAAVNSHSAYRIFSVLNDRGLDLNDSDILKAELIGKIPADLQSKYAQKWEEIEEDLGRKEMNSLFSYVRMIFLKKKYKESVLKEIQHDILEKHFPNKEKDFIDNILIPFSEALQQIESDDYYAAGSDHELQIRSLLRALKAINNLDWMPPALAFIKDHPHDPEAVLKFLQDLERLAASLWLRKAPVSQRIQRYGQVLKWIEGRRSLDMNSSPLQLTDQEKQEVVAVLDGENFYKLVKVPQYVLLRLDEALSSVDLATYNHAKISVEHVLPQNPKPDSEWCQLFTESERQYWVHRLANLVLLAKNKNSQASNYDFGQKKEKYFSAKGGISPFVITSQVLSVDRWTPAVLEQRQADCLAVLKKLWRL